MNLYRIGRVRFKGLFSSFAGYLCYACAVVPVVGKREYRGHMLGFVLVALFTFRAFTCVIMIYLGNIKHFWVL